MKPTIIIISPLQNILHCSGCQKTVSSQEHDCETQSFVYSKEELQELRNSEVK